MQVVSDGEHTYDWLVHPRSDGAVEHGVAMVAASLPDRAPYSVLSDVTAGSVGGEGVCLTWSQGEAAVRVDVRAGGPCELIRGRWPTRSDGSCGGREMFMVRVRGGSVAFAALYQLGGRAARWRVGGVERVQSGLDDEMHVAVTDGLETRRYVFAGL